MRMMAGVLSVGSLMCVCVLVADGQTTPPSEGLSPNEFIDSCRDYNLTIPEIAGNFRKKAISDAIASSIAAASVQNKLSKAEGYYLIAEQVDPEPFRERSVIAKNKWLAEKAIRQLATLIYFNQVRHPDVVDLTEEELWLVFEGKEIFQLSLLDNGRWVKPYLSALSQHKAISNKARFRGVLEQLRVKWSRVDSEDDPFELRQSIVDAIDKLDKLQ